MDAYKGGTEPPLPPITARHVFDWLMEIGPVEATPMGQAPIGWPTIDAWARRTFAGISAWEARLLRRLSTEYLTEIHLAEDPHRQAPWSPRRIEVDQEANERQLRAVLG